MIVKENIKHYEDNNLKVKEMQVTIVFIKTKTRHITIVSIYCPPRFKIEKKEYAWLFRELHNTYITGRDYNAKNIFWGSRLDIPKGKNLYEAISECNCELQSTGKPTYWPSDRGKDLDLIDFFVMRGISLNYSFIEEIHNLTSDHSCIVLTVSETVIAKQPSLTMDNRLTDWEGFQEELKQKAPNTSQNT